MAIGYHLKSTSRYTKPRLIAMPLHERKSPRAKWHDYNGAEYFITICTQNREHYFGDIQDDRMFLTPIGEYATLCIKKIGEIYSDADVPLFVVMPNHIHMIIDVIKNAHCDEMVGLPHCDEMVGLPHCDSPTNGGNAPVVGMPYYDIPTGKNEEMQRRANCCGRLSYIIGQFKSVVTKYANRNKIVFGWQNSYYDRIIRDTNERNRIALYIEQNPIVWKDDRFYGNKQYPNKGTR